MLDYVCFLWPLSVVKYDDGRLTIVISPVDSAFGYVSYLKE